MKIRFLRDTIGTIIKTTLVNGKLEISEEPFKYSRSKIMSEVESVDENDISLRNGDVIRGISMDDIEVREDHPTQTKKKRCCGGK